MEELVQYATTLGIQTCIPFDTSLLHPEERIRDLCRVDRCGSFRKNYMCPPYVGTPEEIRERLKPYRNGLLLRYRRAVDVKNDPQGVKQTKLDFHQKVLLLEEQLRKTGIDTVWGLIGGECALCQACAARIDAPCPYPEKARTSLESIAVDVDKLLDDLELDSGFCDDRITWIGCVLF
jgi:predicted metal-binding protein